MSDDTALAELVWENEGGRVLGLVAGAPGSPRTAGVRVGRIYDPVTEHDGTRVLVDRLWPRGMTRSRARIDEWCKAAAPSTALRTWYHHDPQRFAEFRGRYRRELDAGEQATARRHLAELMRHRTLTLLTASREPATSEAGVLAERLVERLHGP
jgi:uncharacterized protein YeaO (DUF488 family)